MTNIDIINFVDTNFSDVHVPPLYKAAYIQGYKDCRTNIIRAVFSALVEADIEEESENDTNQ